MWCELVEGVCAECTFAPPVSELALQDVEVALCVALPLELRTLLFLQPSWNYAARPTTNHALIKIDTEHSFLVYLNTEVARH